MAQREIFLANKYNLEIFDVDNSPLTKALDRIKKELGVENNLSFITHNARKLPFKDNKFDVIISNAVIYCLEDSEITDFLNENARVLIKNGINLTSIASRISIIQKLNILIKKFFVKKFNINYNNNINLKQTGYMRDVSHIKRFIPSNFKLESVSYGEELTFQKFCG